MLPLLASLVLAAPSAPTLNDQEEQLLSRDKVAVRPPASATGQAMGIVDIEAPAEQVWEAIFDFPARVQETGALDRAEVYAPASDPGGLGVEFELSVFGARIVFSTRYSYQPEQGYCSFGLDPAREQDLVSVQGSYQTLPGPGGQTRLVYRSQTDSGRSVPGFIRRWLAVESLSRQLEGIRDRAQEAAAR